MIQFRIVAIARRTSSEVDTIHYTYENEEKKSERKHGAEWEEVEFAIAQEEKPIIQIANVQGDAFLPSAPIKLIINNPELFGMYKVGDIIEFIAVRPVLTN